MRLFEENNFVFAASDVMVGEMGVKVFTLVLGVHSIRI